MCSSPAVSVIKLFPAVSNYNQGLQQSAWKACRRLGNQYQIKLDPFSVFRKQSEAEDLWYLRDLCHVSVLQRWGGLRFTWEGEMSFISAVCSCRIQILSQHDCVFPCAHALICTPFALARIFQQKIFHHTFMSLHWTPANTVQTLQKEPQSRGWFFTGQAAHCFLLLPLRWPAVCDSEIPQQEQKCLQHLNRVFCCELEEEFEKCWDWNSFTGEEEETLDVRVARRRPLRLWKCDPVSL